MSQMKKKTEKLINVPVDKDDELFQLMFKNKELISKSNKKKYFNNKRKYK